MKEPNVGDQPHEATKTEASDGLGTVGNDKSPGETQDRPILDGATMTREAEAATENPFRGKSDPALSGEKPLPPTDEDAETTEKNNSGSKDVTSDPALSDDEGADWAGEGGATPSGPATDSE